MNILVTKFPFCPLWKKKILIFRYFIRMCRFTEFKAYIHTLQKEFRI